MTSHEPFVMLDLERDLPTTAEDVKALRRAARSYRLDLDGYLRFLSQVPAAPSRARRPGSEVVVLPPFVLPGCWWGCAGRLRTLDGGARPSRALHSVTT